MVEKGSVGIGGTQTGVYSMQSAGGRNIIGKSPVSFFDLSKEKPCFAKAGDKIKFVPISINEFKKIQVEVAINFYKLRNQVIND
jgi:inhibitor of KinA